METVAGQSRRKATLDQQLTARLVNTDGVVAQRTTVSEVVSLCSAPARVSSCRLQSGCRSRLQFACHRLRLRLPQRLLLPLWY